ncbi:MAG: glycosyltransferase family 2 protein [Lachnospiraceae bacterium]|nr:glycosyltransferase family 2 protein [Lachnospiraceae bacterium]
MLLSVVIPVYNIEEYIKECIDSVLCQNFSDYEIILIDDGSTDDSGKICDEYAREHECIHVIHQKNQGQGKARNQGIRISKGDYIIFIDGDDYLYCKDNFRNLAHCIQKKGDGPDIVAYHGVSVFSDGNKKIYNKSYMNDFHSDDAGEGYTAEKFLAEHLKGKSMFFWFPWFYAYDRRMFASQELQFPEGRKYEDLYLTWRILLKAERIEVMSDIVYVYRRNRKNSTSEVTSYQNLSDFLWAIEENIRDAEQKLPDGELKSLLLNDFARQYHSLCTLATFLPKEEKKEMMEELKSNKKYIDYATGGKYAFIRKAEKIFGFENVFRILHLRCIWLRYRDKRKKEENYAA